MTIVKITSVAIVLSTAGALFVNTLGVAHATDPATRRPLYVIKLSKSHVNVGVKAPNGSFIGQSPYNDFNSNKPAWRVGLWGHWVNFKLQILDNNRQPYGKGNPVEQFSKYRENSKFKAYRDGYGQAIGPRYNEGDFGTMPWTPEDQGILRGKSDFIDTMRALHPDRPRSDDGRQKSTPSTYWFEFNQQWWVDVRRGEGAPPGVEGRRFKTESLHHLEATQADRARTNAGAKN